MRRLILGAASALALMAGAVVVTGGPASAATGVTATSVALASEDANCADADLAIGMTATATDTETGLITNSAGDTLGQFSQAGDWAGQDGVYDGYGQPVSPDQPEGTIIGSYASVGTAPLTASTAAEWFVLYRCSDTPGGNVVLYSCFGDLGTCPQTAVEALADSLAASVSPTSVAPGGALTVTGSGCFDQLAGALLLKDGAATGVGDTVAPEADGTFAIPLVVPADATPGGDYSIRVDCGSEEGGVQQSLVLDLQVVAPSTTTSAAPARPAEVTPAFTG